MRVASGVARLIAAVVGVSALTAHLLYSLGSGGAALSNFFSYFTMQSAILAVILWGIGGVLALRSADDPAWLVSARMIVTTYQVVSGIVYTIIVAESLSRGLSIQVPPSSQVLHYWMPAFALLDWMVAPGRGRVRWRSLRALVAFPIAWGAFTMLRGSLVGWYPYFFLDPFQVAVPWELAAYCAAVLAFIASIAVVLVLISWVVPRAGRARRLAGEERLEAPPRPLDELVVPQLRERDGALAPDQAHQDR